MKTKSVAEERLYAQSSQSRHIAATATSPSPITKSSAAAPVSAVRSTFFDPWNSSSTGHQRAENRMGGSTSWRQSRNAKLGEQFRGGLSGGAKRVADSVGAGSEGFGKDGRKPNGGWGKGAAGLRTGGQKSLDEVWGASKGVKGEAGKPMRMEKLHLEMGSIDDMDRGDCKFLVQTSSGQTPMHKQHKQMFEGLCFYINGSTAPLVSDFKLKQLLAERGGKISIGLGRRTVTHVILGTASAHGGVGGGLAATKMQKEIAKIGGKGVKFVDVEWVLASIRHNARQSESRFSSLKLAPKNQSSVYRMLRRTSSSTSSGKSGEEGRASNSG
ncbi:hypothetical protein K504DRAFT_375296 [Pleomassaria siparia CBS 279.74]|uniref:BRCT domain-containing protein n=1 Tax=Pleomassaria siparia CBS 279.74 TaxID=1314801 RepID=A0A6G1KG80_9PLEO|nr:hypothetical protein K504DRAFT_375296 [Pleomassaria siparia CBS 279.74]